MKTIYLVLLAMVILGMAAELRAQTNEPDEQSVRHFLMATYANEVTSQDGSRAIRGLHFSRNRPITKVNAPLLKTAWPETVFFTTTISRPDWDYREVNIVVAATRRHGVNTFQTTFIPPFTPFTESFFEVFQSNDLISAESPTAVATAIGELITSVDPAMDYRVDQFEKENRLAIHFIHMDKSWAVVNVWVNDQGSFDKVTVAKRMK